MENTTAISDSEDPFADFEDFCLLADKNCLKDFTMPPVPETSLEKAMTDNANCEKVPLLEQIKPCEIAEESIVLRKKFDVIPQTNSEPSDLLNGTLENSANSKLEPMETSDVIPKCTELTNGNSTIVDEFSGTNGEFSMSDDLSGIIDSLVNEEMEVEESMKEWAGTKNCTTQGAQETSIETPKDPSSQVEKPTQDVAIDPNDSEEVDFSLDLEGFDENDDQEPIKTDKDFHPEDVLQSVKEDAVFQTEEVPLESEKAAEVNVLESEKTADEAAVLDSAKTSDEATVLASEKAAEVNVLESAKTAHEAAVLASEKSAEVNVLESAKTADEAAVLDSAKTVDEAAVLDAAKTAEVVVLDSAKTVDEAAVLDAAKTAEVVVLESVKTAEVVVLESEKTAHEAAVLDSEKTAEVVVLESAKTAHEAAVLDASKTAEAVVLDSAKTAEVVVLESEKTAEVIVFESEKTAKEVAFQTEKATDSTDLSEDLNIWNKTGSKSIELSQSEQSDPDKMTTDTVEYNGEIETTPKTVSEPPTDFKSSPEGVAEAEASTEVNSENMEIEIVKASETADSLLKNDVDQYKNSMDETSFPSNLDVEMDAENNRRSKRENDDVGGRANKKVKTDATTSAEVLHYFEDPKNEKITITRKLLDEIVLIKLTELLTEVGDFGFARNKAEATELERENLKKQKCAIMKTMDDQRKVVRKFTEDRKNAKNYTNNVIPAKVTRSVGLQVCTVGHRFVTPPKPILPPPGPLPKTFSPTVPNRQVKPQPITPTINRPLAKTTTPTNKPIIMRQNARKTTTPVTPTFSPRPINAEVKAVTPRTSDVIDLTEDPRKASLKPLNGVKKSPVAESFLQQALAIKKPELKPPFPPVPPSPYPPKTVLPPKPMLRISRTNADQKSGIMLSWHFTEKETTPISKFQVYSYQEGSDSGKDVWKKVGDVDALVLPMACTLTQFKEGYKYYFSVRAIDKNAIKGPFSDPNCIKLFPRKTVNSL